MELGSRSFLGGCYDHYIFKDTKKRHYDDVSVLNNKNVPRSWQR